MNTTFTRMTFCKVDMHFGRFLLLHQRCEVSREPGTMPSLFRGGGLLLIRPRPSRPKIEGIGPQNGRNNQVKDVFHKLPMMNGGAHQKQRNP